MLKKNSLRFAAALLATLAGVVAGPTAAPPAAPQHHDQAPGFYRLKVGDLEVTALFDGTGVFDPHWLNGTTAKTALKFRAVFRNVEWKSWAKVLSSPPSV